MLRLRSLFVKPTFACTANCVHCRHRRSLYDRIDHDRKLTFQDYTRFFVEAKKLGTDSLHISGGEPILYEHLPDLIEEGKRQRWFVILNTNGSHLNHQRASELFRAGLDAVIISIHSSDPLIHDSMRQRNGHWDKAVESIKLLSEMRKEYNPDFLLTTQTIITRSNYQDMPKLLQLMCQLGSDSHGFSYLEGDFERELLLSVEEIEHFKQTLIPELLNILRSYPFTNRVLKYAALRYVSKLFDEKRNSLSNYALGVYRDEKYSPRHCRAPETFAMILPNGDVHPCNMVEYVHEPVVGNVLKKSLPEIWCGPEWTQFRKDRFHWCRFCPTHLHFHIPLAINMRRLFRLALRNPAPEQKSVKERIANAVVW